MAETFVYQRRSSNEPWALSYEIIDHGTYCEIDAIIYQSGLYPNGRKSAHYEGLKNYRDVANWLEATMLGAGIYFDHEDYDQLKGHFLERRGFAAHVHTRKKG